MNYICNPINYGYKYQFNKQPDGRITASREGADPSMVWFKGKYLIFPSMTCGFLYSDDLANWQFHALENMPVYDYAPDVRVVGEWLYFCASSSLREHSSLPALGQNKNDWQRRCALQFQIYHLRGRMSDRRR